MKTKIKNIKALIRGKISPTNTKLNIVLNELENVINSKKVKPINQANILKVVYLLRSLESTLNLYLEEHTIQYNGHSSLGKLFHTYKEHTSSNIGNIDPSELTRYINNLSKYRNKFMHNAGQFPANEKVIKDLLNEIDICLVRILNL